MKRPKVSVIIPVYKSEPYIERCVRSLFGQTLDDLEFVFIDDCSPDYSINVMERVLSEYTDRKSQVKVIRHDVNLGVSAARQHGVDIAKGEYIIHCDPDDWVDPNFYETLYTEAKAKNADIVICDFCNHQNGEEAIIIQQPKYLDNISVLEGISGRLLHKLHGSLCNKLIKADCYTKSSFYLDITYCEDVAILFQILSHNVTISYVPNVFYHYRIDVPGSLVKKSDDAAIESDIRLIDHLQKLRYESNTRLNYCIDSMTASIIYSRAFLMSSLNDAQFKNYFYMYKSCIKRNLFLGRARKFLILLATNGYYHWSRNTYYYLLKIKSHISKFFNK